MSRKTINPAHAPTPVGPYHQAVVTGNLVYTSGQIAIDPVSNQVVQGTISEQTRLVLSNLRAVLDGAGSSLRQVVKTTVFLKNMNDFAAMNTVYAEFFPADNAPARSTIEIARLPKDLLVEIEAVATIG